MAGLADDRHVRECMRLHAGREVRLHVLRIGGRLLPVVANAEVEGQVGADAPVVLREEAIAVPVRIRIQARVLPHAGRNPGEEVRQAHWWYARSCCRWRGEGEGAVVVERGKLEVLLQACFAAKVQRVPAARRAQHVANAVNVCAGLGPGDGLAKREAFNATDADIRA